MQKRNAAETKERILETSERIFAEKGFDGARVDDIAAEAGVNKALLYYYFKSKDDILDTLLGRLMESITRKMTETLGSFPDISRGEDYKPLLNAYLDFTAENSSMIKVAVTESLKIGARFSIIKLLTEFIASPAMSGIREGYGHKGIQFPEDRQELLVTEFFMGLLPVINFAMFKDQWAGTFNVSEEALRENFFKAYMTTHIAAHRNSDKP